MWPPREPARHGDGFHDRAVVGYDHQGDELAGRLIGAVFNQWPALQRFSGLDGALGGAHGARQSELGCVVHDVEEPPSVVDGGLELEEVRLPQTVGAHRRLQEHFPLRRGAPTHADDQIGGPSGSAIGASPGSTPARPLARVGWTSNGFSNERDDTQHHRPGVADTSKPQTPC